MSWLITLVLFWAIGSWVAKGLDLNRDRTRKRHAAHLGNIQSVKGNIYAIAWQECENIQNEFRTEYPVIPPEETFLRYYAKVYGRSIQQDAVIRALSDLRGRGQDVLRAGDRYGVEPTIVHPSAPYDPIKEAEGVRGLLYPLYGPFNMSQAAKVTDERAIFIAKQIWHKERIGTNITQWDDTTRWHC